MLNVVLTDCETMCVMVMPRRSAGTHLMVARHVLVRYGAGYACLEKGSRSRALMLASFHSAANPRYPGVARKRTCAGGIRPRPILPKLGVKRQGHTCSHAVLGRGNAHRHCSTHPLALSHRTRCEIHSAPNVSSPSIKHRRCVHAHCIRESLLMWNAIQQWPQLYPVRGCY